MSNQYTITLNNIKCKQTVNLLGLCHAQNPDMCETSNIFDVIVKPLLSAAVDTATQKESVFTFEPTLEGDRFEYILTEARDTVKTELALINVMTGSYVSLVDVDAITLGVTVVNNNLR